MKSKNSIYKIVTVGLLGALVFVSNYLSFPIPVPVGDISRIHLGNAFCLLAGFVMGPIGGGLASGIGAMLYDLTNPAYIASAPFTFVFKFLLAAVCGLIAHKGKITGNMLEEDFTITVPRSIVAGICGQPDIHCAVSRKVLHYDGACGQCAGGCGDCACDESGFEHGERDSRHHHFRAALRFDSQGAEKCASDDKIKSAYKESRRNTHRWLSLFLCDRDFLLFS